MRTQTERELPFRRRARIEDRLAGIFIAANAALVIAAILGIGAFLFFEALPLLSGARMERVSALRLAGAGEEPRLVLVDERREEALIIAGAPKAFVHSLKDGRLLQEVELAGLDGAVVQAASRSGDGSTVALGTDTGAVWVGELALDTGFEGTEPKTVPRVEREAVVEIEPGHPISALSHAWSADYGVIACILDEQRLVLSRIAIQRPLVGEPVLETKSDILSYEDVGAPTTVLVLEDGAGLLVGTRAGEVARFKFRREGEPELAEIVRAVSEGAVTGLTPLLGGRSFVVGGSDGSVSTWSLVGDPVSRDGKKLTLIHPFQLHSSPVRTLIPSPRDKSFVAVFEDGKARLMHMTTERALAERALGFVPEAVAFAPKADGAVFTDGPGRLEHWFIANPHPDVSLKTLFRKVWYEGHDEPKHTWQSHGATDDFEPKFGLVPLVFGTLKGTLYAMLFSVPLALFGALYTSQFLDKKLRGPCKSVIELMASLPSVVLGFVAGLVLAPLVERHIVSVLIVPLVVPGVVFLGMLLCAKGRAPSGTFSSSRELWLLCVWIAAGLWAAALLGPWLERVLFGGRFDLWMNQAAGIRYDQRNSIVVGWAMGFAIIPIIFTICEDAFSSVPRHLVSASLACGATAWQTATRVVLPAAGSGVFSGVMVGFGRAVGETMIVLMATGNTPIMDWSIFNGFRALSANIAVEIPEAPFGSSHYRVLFVAALILFGISFVVNTAAEIVRLKLRARLAGL
ncbi:MAG: ABC transporter permease subunit [Candidatus Omnitrophica bacterium]|nr:ABC transporter permease subunit [Candidatus Omnitrophota bacterium]